MSCCLPRASAVHPSPPPAPPRHRRDFDPFSLRMELPGAVAALAQSAAAHGGTAYVHCTGGWVPTWSGVGRGGGVGRWGSRPMVR